MKPLFKNDLASYSSAELSILERSIKEQKEERQAAFINQFTEGSPLAIKDDKSERWFPAYVYKVNKASVKIIFASHEKDNRPETAGREETLEAKLLSNMINENNLRYVYSWSNTRKLKTQFQIDCEMIVKS